MARGITPACAGNSSHRYRSRRNGGDHPRLRGEQIHKFFVFFAGLGSPPLARGTGTVVDTKKALAGITPACAGNSILFFAFRDKSRDHPRLRGEQTRTTRARTTRRGSPPLARGTGNHGRCNALDGGITPACAGNSKRIVCIHTGYRDHPRLRGEQSIITRKSCCIVGSPPLARGTVYANPQR